MMDKQRIEGFVSRESLPVGVLIELLFGDSVDSLEQQRRAIIFYPDLVTEKENKKNQIYENFSEWVVALIHPHPGNRASLLDILDKPVNTQDFYSWLYKNKRKLPLPSEAKLFIKAFEENLIKRNQSTLDRSAKNNMVDRPLLTETTGQYQPSNARREARKKDTQDMRKRWRKVLREWKKKRPNMSDSWYSQQIAQMDIAQGRSSETIRKNMKI